eukprot:m.174174 g.174174  ORF g.174174 m.174174 type:complete len:272 (+) comp15404_c0_seq4:162-977(+)
MSTYVFNVSKEVMSSDSDSDDNKDKEPSSPVVLTRKISQSPGSQGRIHQIRTCDTIESVQEQENNHAQGVLLERRLQLSGFGGLGAKGSPNTSSFVPSALSATSDPPPSPKQSLKRPGPIAMGSPSLSSLKRRRSRDGGRPGSPLCRVNSGSGTGSPERTVDSPPQQRFRAGPFDRRFKRHRSSSFASASPHHGSLSPARGKQDTANIDSPIHVSQNMESNPIASPSFNRSPGFNFSSNRSESSVEPITTPTTITQFPSSSSEVSTVETKK